MSITKHINASTRMVLDSVRTLFIWMFSLAVAWETFCWVEIIGFLILVVGQLLYNAVVKLPWSVYEQPPSAAAVQDEHATPLLGDQAGDVDVGAAGSVNASGGLSSFDHVATSTPTLSRASVLKGK